MKTNFTKLIIPVFSFFLISLLSSCLQEETPTKVRMQGNWQLVEATDANGEDILSKVAFPVTAIQLTDDNGMIGTQGPMFTYIVYGGSKWIEASAKIKQIFDYANFRFNTGEFFVGEGVQQRFTVEAKLQATAAVGGLKDVLEIFGVGNGFFQQVIYHRFIEVRVSFPNQSSTRNDRNSNTMVWKFDNTTLGVYNYKDAQGNFLAWRGWPVESFSRARFVWRKKTEGLNEIVSANL
jgi:hypothetical protein